MASSGKKSTGKKAKSRRSNVIRLAERRRTPIADRDQKLTAERRQYFEGRALSAATRNTAKRYYDEQLFRMVRFNIPAGLRVLEIGSGLGDLLDAVKPSFGVGIDFSPKMVAQARRRHPDLHFVVGDAADLPVKGGTFDAIILSNLVGDLVDVQRVLEQLPDICTPDTRIVISHYNFAWEPLVRLSELLGLRHEHPEQNWLRPGDVENLMRLANLEPIKTGRNLLAPLPGRLSTAINKYIATLPGVSRLCLNDYVVGRMTPAPRERDYTVSVIVACKDERGNIEEIVRTVPKMGLGTELIFCDGHSTDGTLEEIERCIRMKDELNPDLDDICVFVQPTTGKGEAVFMGFDAAVGDILMILDADITVRSEELPKFYEALASGRGEFINGSRLVYPQEEEAMRFLNLLANHFFGRTFSWLLEQRLTDTLCGTKVIFKRDYERLREGRAFFGDFDPFGDFDLLFGAAKLNLKICEIPIRYRARDYGEIKISRFKHGWLLLQMAALGFTKFKAFNLDG